MLLFQTLTIYVDPLVIENTCYAFVNEFSKFRQLQIHITKLIFEKYFKNLCTISDLSNEQYISNISCQEVQMLNNLYEHHVFLINSNVCIRKH